MVYKFEKLEVWRLALEYSDLIYAVAEQLPAQEMYNLRSQIIRAATSIALNIAEGSTGQTNPEQARFLGLAKRSLVETVACLRLMERRKYLREATLLANTHELAFRLFTKLQAFRNFLKNHPHSVEEPTEAYDADSTF